MAQFELTDFELKLLRLALCESALGGEIATSAQKFIESLRARGVDSATLETALGESSNETIILSQPDWGMTVMPWGKHKGEMIMDIPPSYLRWALRWINEDTDRLPSSATSRTPSRNFSNRGDPKLCLSTRQARNHRSRKLSSST